MKQLLTTIFFLSFCINSFAQNKIYFDKDWKETTAENAEFYRTIEKKGELYAIEDFYISGKLQFEGFAKNTKDPLEKEGTCIWYYKNGKNAQKATFKDNKLHGELLTYFMNGNIKTKGSYINNLANGLHTEFFPSGKIETLSHYLNGKMDGEETKYWHDGTLEKRFHHKNGVLHGTYEFYDYGILKSKGTVKNGFQEGKSVKYHDNSDIPYIEYFVKDKKLDGTYSLYEKTGKKIAEGFFKDGIPQSYTESKTVLRARKKFVMHMELIDGVEHWKSYINDILFFESFYEKGMRVKTWKLYTYDKGELCLTIDYSEATCDDVYIQQVIGPFGITFLLSSRFIHMLNFVDDPSENVKFTEIIPTEMGSAIIDYHKNTYEETINNEKTEEVEERIENVDKTLNKTPKEEEEEEVICDRYKDYYTITACTKMNDGINYSVFTGSDYKSLQIIKTQHKPKDYELFMFYGDHTSNVEDIHIAFSVSKKLKKAYKKGNLNTIDIINYIKDDFLYYSKISTEEFTKILEAELNNE